MSDTLFIKCKNNNFFENIRNHNSLLTTLQTVLPYLVTPLYWLLNYNGRFNKILFQIKIPTKFTFLLMEKSYRHHKVRQHFVFLSTQPIVDLELNSVQTETKDF